MRDQYHEQYLRATLQLARAWLRDDRPDAALPLFGSLLETEPLLEDVVRDVFAATPRWVTCAAWKQRTSACWPRLLRGGPERRRPRARARDCRAVRPTAPGPGAARLAARLNGLTLRSQLIH